MCGVNKNKSRTGWWHQKQNQAGLGAGRSKKYANVNYFVRNLLSCFERTSPLAASPPCTCPCSVSFSAWCYQYEYSYSYSHNVCANNFVSYFNRHGNHSTTYLISIPPSHSPSLSYFPAKLCVPPSVSCPPASQSFTLPRPSGGLKVNSLQLTFVHVDAITQMDSGFWFNKMRYLWSTLPPPYPPTSSSPVSLLLLPLPLCLIADAN